MKIMNLFKRKSRRQLIEENRKLQAEVDYIKNIKPMNIARTERNVQKISSVHEVGFMDDVPEHIVEEWIAMNMLEYLKPFIEFDFQHGANGNKIYRGNLYVATGGKQ